MNARIDKIKVHLQENKKVYIASGITAVVVGIGTFLLVRGNAGSDVTQKITQVGLRNEINEVVINLVERSTASRPVHLVGSNLYFNSLSEAARETGHPLSTLSKHVNGLIPNVHGDVFELLEPAA